MGGARQGGDVVGHGDALLVAVVLRVHARRPAALAPSPSPACRGGATHHRRQFGGATQSSRGNILCQIRIHHAAPFTVKERLYGNELLARAAEANGIDVDKSWSESQLWKALMSV